MRGAMDSTLGWTAVRAAFVVALAVGATACQSEDTSEGCQKDSECDAGFFCDQANGACRCRTDDSCGAGFYCNTFGACQPRPPCLGNQDCETGFICNGADPSGGKCIASNECGSSVHCEFNNFCNPQTKQCAPGCRNTGDCQLGHVCVAGACQPGQTATDCTLCPAAPDPDPTYCDYGETCSSGGSCTTHALKTDLCKTCGELTACGTGLVCLIDDEGGNYCAPGCKLDTDCPNGYLGCEGLQLVFAECGTGFPACPGGGKCITTSEGNRGFCECTSQDQCDIYNGAMNMCFFGSCLGGGGSCSTGLDCACQSNKCLGTDLPCATGADCAVNCVQQPSGETTIGICETSSKACGKALGVSCTELRGGTAQCREL